MLTGALAAFQAVKMVSAIKTEYINDIWSDPFFYEVVHKPREN